MTTKKCFLTAEWRKLLMFNYAIDPAVLSTYLPRGTDLDAWENEYYVSLVGFMFEEVRIRGYRIPFHVDFPEVNLRFYVKYENNGNWRRGVVFIKEIVPKPAISFVANTMYSERYITLPMKYSRTMDDTAIAVSYQWKKNKRWNSMKVRAGSEKMPLQADTMEEFIAEHFWGYSPLNSNRTGEYRVDHPRWDIYPVKEYLVDCDFGAVYGKEFSFLSSQKPVSVLLAEGSPVSVFQKRILL